MLQMVLSGPGVVLVASAPEPSLSSMLASPHSAAQTYHCKTKRNNCDSS